MLPLVLQRQNKAHVPVDVVRPASRAAAPALAPKGFLKAVHDVTAGANARILKLMRPESQQRGQAFKTAIAMRVGMIGQKRGPDRTGSRFHADLR
jgi:hypothetical protein